MCASVHVRSAEPEEDHLQTPNCSNTGYEDEEDHHGDDHPGDEAEEEDTAGHGDDGDPGSEGGRGRGWDEEGVAPVHSGHNIHGSAANRLIGKVVQLRRRPLLGPSPG